MLKQVFSVILCSILLSACQPGQVLGPTYTPTATSTLTPTATPTPTPTLTPTITPSPTPTLLGGSEEILIQTYEYYGYKPKIYLYNTLTDDSELLLDGYIISAVSEDGEEALVYKVKEERNHDSVADLFLYNLNDYTMTLLSNEFRTVRVLGYTAADWLEGTDRILFRAGENVIQLYECTGDGEIKQITDTDIGVITFFQFSYDHEIYWIEGAGYYQSGFNWTSLDDRVTERVNPTTKIRTDEAHQIPVLNIDDFLDEKASGFKVSFSYYGKIWSPDHEKLITWLDYCSLNCYSDNSFFVVSKKGEILNHFVVKEGGVDTASTYDFTGCMVGSSFSPDGNHLALQLQYNWSEDGNDAYDNFIIDLPTGEKTITDFGLSQNTFIAGFYWLP